MQTYSIHCDPSADLKILPSFWGHCAWGAVSGANGGHVAVAQASDDVDAEVELADSEVELVDSSVEVELVDSSIEAEVDDSSDDDDEVELVKFSLEVEVVLELSSDVVEVEEDTGIDGSVIRILE